VKGKATCADDNAVADTKRVLTHGADQPRPRTRKRGDERPAPRGCGVQGRREARGEVLRGSWLSSGGWVHGGHTLVCSNHFRIGK